MLKFILVCGCILSSIVAVHAQSKTAIIIQTDDKTAVKAALEPFTYYPLYTYSSSEFNQNRQAVLQFETAGPFMGELKIKNNLRRTVQNIPLYIEPSSSLKITIKNGEVEFQGELSQENKDMKKVSQLFFKLNRQETDKEDIEKQIKEALNGNTYKSGFKEHIRQTAALITKVKNLNGLENQLADNKMALQNLLRDLETERAWLSIHTWPKVLDDIFSKSETADLVKPVTNGYEHRLQRIGDEELRSYYGIYLLGRLIRSRSWFGHLPTDIIQNTIPYITNAQTKEELKEVIREMEYIQQGWTHLLNQPAPDFTFEDVNGKMVSLSDLRGKFVILDVWNIYCGPCMKQIPYLQKMEPELRKMDVEVIGVSCDPQKIKDKWKATVFDKKMAGIQVIMDRGRNSKFMNDYGILGFPTFCLIDPEGYMIHPRMKYPEMPGFMEFIQQKINEYNSKKKQ